jgi:WD40 repeat protein
MIHRIDGISSNEAGGVLFPPTVNGWQRATLMASASSIELKIGNLRRQWSLQGQIVALAFSPDSKLLGATLREGGVVVWDATSGKQVLRQDAHSRQVVWCLSFSPDGRRLATGGSDQSVHVWDLTERRLERVLRGHADEVWSVAFMPDGQSLVSSGKDETIRIWSFGSADGSPLPDRLAGRPVISPDSRLLACRKRTEV